MKNIYIRIRTEEQKQKVLAWGNACAVLFDDDLPPADPAKYSPDRSSREIRAYICLPDVTRQAKTASIEKMIDMAAGWAGLAVKNPDQLEMILEKGFEGPVIADSFLYACNRESIELYRALIPQMRFISSDELTDAETDRIRENVIYKAYGHPVLMITNQCLIRDYFGCGRRTVRFRNEKQDRLIAQSRCSQCYSVIYDGRTVSMLDKLEDIPYQDILVDFTVEDADTVSRILKTLDDIREAKTTGSGNHPAGSIYEEYTRGHHYKGVE